MSAILAYTRPLRFIASASPHSLSLSASRASSDRERVSVQHQMAAMARTRSLIILRPGSEGRRSPGRIAEADCTIGR